MERRVVIKESGNGYICTLQVLDDGRKQILEKEMLVVGNDQACLGETIQELMKYRIRNRKKKDAETAPGLFAEPPGPAEEGEI